MKRFLAPALAVLILTVSLGAAVAQVYRETPPLAPQPPVGVVVEGQFIRPGDPVQALFGAVGFPDKLRAMRGKEQAQDYVNIAYYTYGLLVDVENNQNTIQGLLVQEPRVTVRGIPFRLGDPYSRVEAAWGKPEAEYPNMHCYWKRGVYVGVDGTGRVQQIFIVPPGSQSSPPTGQGE